MEIKTTFLLMMIFETGMPYTWFTLALGRTRGIILMVPITKVHFRLGQNEMIFLKKKTNKHIT
jgi:hypothetical protein